MTKTHYSLITLAVILGGIAYFLPSEEPVLDDDLAVAAPGAVELVDQRSEFQKVYQLPTAAFKWCLMKRQYTISTMASMSQ